MESGHKDLAVFGTGGGGEQTWEGTDTGIDVTRGGLICPEIEAGHLAGENSGEREHVTTNTVLYLGGGGESTAMSNQVLQRHRLRGEQKAQMGSF